MNNDKNNHADPVCTAVTVDLGNRSYDILIGEKLIETISKQLSPVLKQKRVFIVTEETVHAHHGERMASALKEADIQTKWFILKPGESTKSFRQFEELTHSLLSAGIERTDALIAFGGGVIGDLTGYAAASILRGIDFIQIPTTLLAQVDSSVGGKTGINTAFGKNLVGAFYQPKRVIIDTSTLDTLPKRELLAGYAEVVKYSLIDDPDFFTWLEENGKHLISSSQGDKAAAMREQAIAHCCRAKARIVAEDEFENGRRALLNLGHTFGHALEASCGYDGTLLHGEAVAIGMVMAIETSVRLGIATTESRGRITRHFKTHGMKTTAAEIGHTLNADTLLKSMFKDKKVEAGKIGFILGDIGEAKMMRGIDLEIIRSVLHDSIHASSH